MMTISKEQAGKIALQQLGKSRSIEITDVWGDWKVYKTRPLENCWFILTPIADPPILASSRLIAISKEAGKILFDGSVNDEG